MRHGKAEEITVRVRSDAKRALTVAGRSDMEKIASGMAKLGMVFDYVISSPFIRAKQTAQIVAKSAARPPKVTVWNELRPESDTEDARALLAELPPEARVLLVGHEPHLSALVSSLVTTGSSMSMTLKKGGLAVLAGSSSGARLCGTLQSLLTPKQLRACG